MEGYMEYIQGYEHYWIKPALKNSQKLSEKWKSRFPFVMGKTKRKKQSS